MVDIYMNKKTKKSLEDIFKYSMQQYLDEKIENIPTKSEIVRSLIEGLHETMREKGQL